VVRIPSLKTSLTNKTNERAPQRSRQQNQQRQSATVNALRGVAVEDERPSTLNDRFGTSRKPTNNVRQQSGIGRTITFDGAPARRDNRRNAAPVSGRSVLFN
jgi:hypothetical protein